MPVRLLGRRLIKIRTSKICCHLKMQANHAAMRLSFRSYINRTLRYRWTSLNASTKTGLNRHLLRLSLLLDRC